MLGICRGMQAINVYFGGTLHRWIPGHPAAAGRPAARDAYRGAAHGAARPEPVVTSNHHQAVDRLGEGLAVLQRAADGTAECIRHGTLPVWGVQWHPERQSYALRRPDAADGAAIFEAFAAQVEQE